MRPGDPNLDPTSDDPDLGDDVGRLPIIKRLKGSKLKILKPEEFRQGASLLADQDTQSIATDFAEFVGNSEKPPPGATKAEVRAFYDQKVDSSKVDSEKISSERDVGEFEDLTAIDAAYAFSERVYYNGWSEDEDVVLLYRDEEGKRRQERFPFDWYFYVRAEEAKSIPADAWAWLCRKWARKVEPDPKFPDRYWRIYVERKVKKFDPKRRFEMIGDPDWGQHWVTPFLLSERPHALKVPADRERWEPIHEVLAWLERKGIEPLEADLTPKQRFMTDHDLKIQGYYRSAFMDIETDDSVGGFDQKEESRVTSIAWEGDRIEKDPTDKGFLILGSETDAGEKRLLLEFRDKVLNRYDLIAAWNGSFFDFPVLIARFAKHKIRFEWRKIIAIDPLPVFKRHYIRAGSDAVSFSLDAIGAKVLGIGKVDWRAKFREKHPRIQPTFINLYRHAPELLREYNEHDAHVLRKLEAFTGFVSIEQIFCRISNGFVNDLNISTKIDQLLLKKGFKEGYHFKTRRWRGDRSAQYQGAYVFPPKVGMFRNVAALDFKSLYPSMVRAYNVSPETIVKAKDRYKYDPSELTTAPFVDCELIDEKTGKETGETVTRGGATFLRRDEGYISQMFVRTLERRKKYTDLQKKRLDVVGTTQDDLFLLYYRLAYSFKRLGLSFYGDLGNSRGRYYDTELAEAITVTGQFYIKKTATYATEHGFPPLYGDTDSVYIQLGKNDETWTSDEKRIETLIERGNAFVDYCQARYEELGKEHNCQPDWHKAIVLEYEDVYDKIIFIKKKRYAGRMLSHKGGKTDHIEVKGLEIMRSDTAAVTRSLQKRVLEVTLKEDLTGDEIMETVIRPEFRRCLEGKMKLEEITIGKGLSRDVEDYKAATPPIHVRLAAEMKAAGHEYFVGMKVLYVVIRSKPTQDAIPLEVYEQSGRTDYDRAYYWDNVIYPASMRILEVAFPGTDWKAATVARKKHREKVVEQLERWFLDPKRVGEAISRIRDGYYDGSTAARARLEPEDIERLRRAPRVRTRVKSSPRTSRLGSRCE